MFRKGSAEGISVEESELLAANAAASKAATVEVSSERYKHFMSLLYKLVQENYQVFATDRGFLWEIYYGGWEGGGR